MNLHEDSIPKMSEELKNTWSTIINDENHHIIVSETDGRIVSSCGCGIIPNLTRNVRPYAFIENVVTHEDYRKQGLGRKVIEMAIEDARAHNCYMVCLLSGASRTEAHEFYKKLGFSGDSKKGFVIRF